MQFQLLLQILTVQRLQPPREIARRYLQAGCPLAHDELVVTVGCAEALHLALRAVAKPGDTLWGMAARELPGVDRREAVARIRTLNGMSPSATIVAGQEVSIPSA